MPKKSETNRQEPGRKGTETFNPDKNKTQESKNLSGQQGRMGKSEQEFGKSQNPSSRQEKSAFFEKEDQPDYSESSKRRAQQGKGKGFESEDLEEENETGRHQDQEFGKTSGLESKQHQRKSHPIE